MGRQPIDKNSWRKKHQAFTMCLIALKSIDTHESATPSDAIKASRRSSAYCKAQLRENPFKPNGSPPKSAEESSLTNQPLQKETNRHQSNPDLRDPCMHSDHFY